MASRFAIVEATGRRHRGLLLNRRKLRSPSLNRGIDPFGYALFDHLELENGVDFPRGRAPWMMEFVVPDELYL